MKFFNSALLVLLFAFSASTSAFAVVTPTTDKESSAISMDNMVDKMFPPGVELTEKQMKRKAKMEKAISKVQKKIAKVNAKRAAKGKAAIDFSDPVKKWLWFWLLGWAAGLLLTIIGGVIGAGSVVSGNAGGLGTAGIFWILATLCYLFGTVSLVIWIIKNFT